MDNKNNNSTKPKEGSEATPKADVFECNVVDRIESEKITPRAKWKFSVHEYILWIVGVLLLIGGGIAVSVALYMLSENDLDLYRQAGGSTIRLVLVSMPYLWGGLLIAFILLARHYVRNTKNGYKFNIGMVSGVTVVVSVILGGVFHVTGVGQMIDIAFEERVPAYAQFFAPHHQIWDRPEDGLLTGIVVEIQEIERFEIEDPNGEIWEVVITEEAPVRARREEADLMPGVLVRVVGEVEDELVFEATEVRVLPNKPFGPKGMHDVRTLQEMHNLPMDAIMFEQ